MTGCFCKISAVRAAIKALCATIPSLSVIRAVIHYEPLPVPTLRTLFDKHPIRLIPAWSGSGPVKPCPSSPTHSVVPTYLTQPALPIGPCPFQPYPSSLTQPALPIQPYPSSLTQPALPIQPYPFRSAQPCPTSSTLARPALLSLILPNAAYSIPLSRICPLSARRQASVLEASTRRPRAQRRARRRCRHGRRFPLREVRSPAAPARAVRR